jgi:II/X family phage/plasmid replication protein
MHATPDLSPAHETPGFGAVDSVRLISPTLDEDTFQAVLQTLDRIKREEIGSGHVKYRIVTGWLSGPFDHKISIRADEYERVLKVEGSVHKALLGHNVYGGPQRPRLACRWLIRLASRQFGVAFPHWSEWRVARIDSARVLRLESEETCHQVITMLRDAEYPRRKTLKYGEETVMFVGSTSTAKVYCKGPEFRKNDQARIRKAGDPNMALYLASESKPLLRFEVEVKLPKLKEHFGETPLIGDLEASFLDQLADVEGKRIMRELAVKGEKVRDSGAVFDRLSDNYSRRQAQALHHFYLRASAEGEEAVKRSMARSSFYRQRSMLKEAGVDWKGVRHHESDAAGRVPLDFSLLSDSRYLVLGEHPNVASELDHLEAEP